MMNVDPVHFQHPALQRRSGRIVYSVFGRNDLKGIPCDGDEESRRVAEKEYLADFFALNPDRIVFIRQVHGKSGFFVEDPSRFREGVYYGEGDALATDQPGLLLVVRTADCIPYFFGCEDPETGKAMGGIIHAGWKGMHQRILESFFQNLPSPWKHSSICEGFTGPAIGFNAYEVGPEVAEYFSRTKKGREDRFFLDLPGEARDQAGPWIGRDPRPRGFDACTVQSNHLFFSHRKGDRERNLNTLLIES